MSAEIQRKSYFENNPLHAAILLNNYSLFIDCLSSPNINVDQRNEKGDTPLLACIKSRRPEVFFIALINKECDVNIPNNNNKTPLSTALKNRNYHIAHKLIKKGANFDVDYNVISEYFLDALLDRDWSFIMFIMRHKPDFVRSVLPDLIKDQRPGTDHLLSVLVALCELEQHLSQDPYRRRFNLVGTCVTQYLLQSGSFLTFRCLWPHLDHRCISSNVPSFLQRFFNDYNLSDEQFVECLNIILASPHVSSFFEFYKERDDCESFFSDLLEACVRCGVDSVASVHLLCLGFSYLKVTSYDILTLYKKQGINNTTLLLLSALHRKTLISSVKHHKFAFEFLNALEKDSTIESKHINSIGLIASHNNRNFKNWFDKTLHENIYLKRQCTNRKVPSLFDVSALAAQKYLLQTHYVGTPDEFQGIANDMCLPVGVKRRLGFRIPICYRTN